VSNIFLQKPHNHLPHKDISHIQQAYPGDRGVFVGTIDLSAAASEPAETLVDKAPSSKLCQTEVVANHLPFRYVPTRRRVYSAVRVDTHGCGWYVPAIL